MCKNFLYEDDIVLISNNESELQLPIDEIYEVFVEYGMKISPVYMNGEVKRLLLKMELRVVLKVW